VNQPHAAWLSRRSLLAAGLFCAAVTVTLPGCASQSSTVDTTASINPTVTSAPIGREDLAPFYSQVASWQPYGEVFDASGLSERIQTSVIDVPIDYDNPAAGTTSLTLYRQVAADSSDGAIVLNPGGPGGGGDVLVLDADFIFQPAVLETRDIVSFDPRGVGRSNPIICRTPQQLDAAAELIAGSEEAIAAAAEFKQACLDTNQSLLSHVDTSNVARDLDVIRSVLRQPTLDYLGFSYGTEIGQRYLQLFPERSGRLVLDAPVAVGAKMEEVLRVQAEGFENSYSLFVDDYVQACRDGDNDCGLGENSEQVRATVLDVVATANDSPLPATDGRVLTGDALTSVIAYLLYSDDSWEDGIAAVEAARAGDGSPGLEMFDLFSEREPDGSYADNSWDAYFAISAVDRPTSLTLDGVAQLTAELEQISPLFGAGLAWETWQVNDWPAQPDEQLVPAKENFTTIPEVLIIGGANDPATPLVWAESTEQLLPGSVLVVWDGVGHTATGGGSECIDDIVTEFLLEGVLPGQGTVCPA
jgi:pimeloyl-ACP methyl ester carboxylesterase